MDRSARRRVTLLLAWAIGDDAAPFEPALAPMYGRETLEKALALFNQDEGVLELSLMGSNF